MMMRNFLLIVLYIKCTYYKSAKYRTINFFFFFASSLIPCSLPFTPPLPSNPIYHQLSQKECFLYLVYQHIYLCMHESTTKVAALYDSNNN